MIQVPSLLRHSTYGHKFSASRIAGTVWENQCSNLLLGNGQLLDLATPDLRVPGIPDDVLRQVILQASHLAQDRTANV